MLWGNLLLDVSRHVVLDDRISVRYFSGYSNELQ